MYLTNIFYRFNDDMEILIHLLPPYVDKHHFSKFYKESIGIYQLCVKKHQKLINVRYLYIGFNIP